jgi:3-hydroxyacyl-CoA dehydrogenase
MVGKQNKSRFLQEGKDILTLDLDTLEYRAAKRFLTLELTKTIDKPINRFKVLVKEKTKAGEFYRKVSLECLLMLNRILKYLMNYTK